MRYSHAVAALTLSLSLLPAASEGQARVDPATLIAAQKTAMGG